jgi:5-methylcytosine-specific restriction endonuclease McrA
MVTNMKVLALSSNYEPLGTIPWEKAINLLFLDKVMAVGEYDEEIRSPSICMKIPSVVVYKNNRWRKINSVRFSRNNVWIRDEGKCQYCGDKVHIKNFTLDHVNPKASGGKTMWTNVVTCCYICNQKKGDKTLKQAGMQLLKAVIKPSSLPFIQTAESYYSERGLHPTWQFWLER